MKLWASKWELPEGTLVFYDDGTSEIREHHESFASEREWARGIDCD